MFVLGDPVNGKLHQKRTNLEASNAALSAAFAEGARRHHAPADHEIVLGYVPSDGSCRRRSEIAGYYLRCFADHIVRATVKIPRRRQAKAPDIGASPSREPAPAATHAVLAVSGAAPEPRGAYGQPARCARSAPARRGGTMRRRPVGDSQVGTAR